MLSNRFNLATQLVLGLLPVYYGAILLAALPNTWQLTLAVGLGLLLLLVLCGSMGYPPQTIWPVFCAAVLILAGSAALFQGAFDRLPLTHQPSELFAIYIVAALYLGWGIRATWKAYASFA